MDIRLIMDFLPHRYPFLLVDRVTRIEPGVFIEAYKCVSFNEPFFLGHFPGLPVMPGVLIVEAMAQAGGLMVLADKGKDFARESVFLFTGMENVRLRKPVLPGDRLELRCELTRQKMRIWKMHGTAHVDGALAAEGELSAAIVPREAMP
ncbi:3-hydroxyacyl-ACP dehydratase FabZ [Desulfovibrio sp. OttesenSCG-928-A18]|nr:3-hydroxyacyl-ACP dehydratase FabZ [Desulfovibrio sp. OttesenSCG-928-A18]